jgi:hypothetical protein
VTSAPLRHSLMGNIAEGCSRLAIGCCELLIATNLLLRFQKSDKTECFYRIYLHGIKLSLSMRSCMDSWTMKSLNSPPPPELKDFFFLWGWLVTSRSAP